MSAGIASGPGALPELSDRRTIFSSDMVKGAEHSTTGEGLSGRVGWGSGAFQTFSERYSAKVVARRSLEVSFP